MAHYVAELIVRAEIAPLPERDEAERQCARAILDLWAQARAFPAKNGPFEAVDRVIEVMNSLHPDSNPYYRNSIWRALEDQAKSASSEVNHLLATACGIDGAARNLIHYVLSEASRVAGRECEEWLELVEQLDQEDAVMGLRVMIPTAGKKEATLLTHRVDQLQKRIEMLDHFAIAATALKVSLTDALASAQPRNSVRDDAAQDPAS